MFALSLVRMNRLGESGASSVKRAKHFTMGGGGGLVETMVGTSKNHFRKCGAVSTPRNETTLWIYESTKCGCVNQRICESSYLRIFRFGCFLRCHVPESCVLTFTPCKHRWLADRVAPPSPQKENCMNHVLARIGYFS